MGTKTKLSLLTCAALVASAHADITITEGGTLVTFETVQFNDPGLTLVGPVVEGMGSTSGLIVEFYGAGEDLQAVAAGAARVSGLDGAFTSLSVGLQDPTMAFDNLQFNLIAKATGSVTITAYSTKGGSVDETFAISTSGSNVYTVVSTTPDDIDYIEIDTTVEVQDIRQFRFNGTQVVPEPGTWAALGIGALLLAARRRRRI